MEGTQNGGIKSVALLKLTFEQRNYLRLVGPEIAIDDLHLLCDDKTANSSVKTIQDNLLTNRPQKHDPFSMLWGVSIR